MGMCKSCNHFNPIHPNRPKICSGCDGYSKYESICEPTVLKPCPCCRGEAELCKDSKPDGYVSYEIAYVACKSCGIRTNDYITDGYYGADTSVWTAINVWNRRPE